MPTVVYGRETNPPRYAILFPCTAGGTDALKERQQILEAAYLTWAARHADQARRFDLIVGPMGIYARPALNGSSIAHYPRQSELSLWLDSLVHALKPRPVYHTGEMPGHIWVPCNCEHSALALAARMMDVVDDVVPGKLHRLDRDTDHWGVVVDVDTPTEAATLLELVDINPLGVRGWSNSNTYAWH